MTKLKLIGAGTVAFVLIAIVTACSPSGASTQPEASSTPQGGIAVEEKLLDVDITLPASFFSDLTPEEIESNAAESGYTKAVVGADGSVTYTIPRPLYLESLANMATGIDDGIAETVTKEDSIQEITHNTKYTAFTMTVDRAAFESSMSAGFVAFGLGLQSMFFQSFDGVAETDRRAVVTYVDVATGEEFGNYILPDALK